MKLREETEEDSDLVMGGGQGDRVPGREELRQGE